MHGYIIYISNCEINVTYVIDIFQDYLFWFSQWKSIYDILRIMLIKCVQSTYICRCVCVINLRYAMFKNTRQTWSWHINTRKPQEAFWIQNNKLWLDLISKLNGLGHFQTILISRRKKDLYIKYRKISNFNGKPYFY